MALPKVFSQFTGYEVARLDADGAVAGGVAMTLEHIGIKSDTTPGVLEWYEDSDAATAGNKRGGVSGVADGWTWIMGLHQNLSQLYLDLDAYVLEAVVVFVRS